jgi:hypothetical protein
MRRADLAGSQVRRDHLAQRGGVYLKTGVVERCLLGGAELVADVAGQVLRGGDQPTGRWVVVDKRGELVSGVVFGGAEQAGDLGEVRFAAGVEADGQHVGGGVGAQPRGARCDDAFVEDGGLGGPLPDRVELFQRQYERRVGVVPEAALR